MRKKRMKILFASSEVVPFAKTGGLADVSGALPKHLKALGHDVRVLMPKYSSINETKFKLREVIRLRDLEVPIGDQIQQISIKSGLIPGAKVQVYFIDYPEYYSREGLYTDPKSGEAYADNDARFILLSRAALEITKVLYWQPDVIHCNDWQTALIPLYLKTLYADDPFFANTRTVLSVHNLGYQGLFPPSAMRLTGLPESLFYPLSPVEFYGSFSFLKTGIEYSDIITTVSEKYAQEIQTDPEYGAGLEGVLQNRTQDLFGILNGIDDRDWNPQFDDLIARKFTKADIGGKADNKKALLERCGLKYNDRVPVIGIISRLADQKGFDLIEAVLEKIAALDMQMVILGTGDEKYHRLFQRAAEQYPGKFSVHLTFNNQLAHMIEAGSDIFLMPSRYEPCGLNQMYSFMYGTVPLVRATGGLADTVKDVTENPESGTGFVFHPYDSQVLLETIERAVAYHQQSDAWRKLQLRGMDQDFSWRKSAQKYIDIYELAHEKPRLAVA
jgi:starch synthase